MADDRVRLIQTLCLFVAIEGGNLSQEALEWIDEEAPGYIRFCLKARPAFEALQAGKDPEDIAALVPKTVEHEISLGTLFGGLPPWAKEAVEALYSSDNPIKHIVKLAAALTEPWDQIVAHYFVLKTLTFSQEPSPEQLDVYHFIIAGWTGPELDIEIVKSLQDTTKDLLPTLLGLEPLDPSIAAV